MATKKVLILISGSGSNLQAFIDQQLANQLGGEICAVISNKADAFGLTRAKTVGIDALTLEHKQFASREEFDQALAAKIDAYQPDLIILAGFMRILSSAFVQKYCGKLLNIHPSLLPKYPGLHTHQRALDNGDQYHGCSVHFVTEELDGGPVIAQAQLMLDATINAEQLAQSVQKLEHRLYPAVARWFLDERLAMTDKGVSFDNQILRQPIQLESAK